MAKVAKVPFFPFILLLTLVSLSHVSHAALVKNIEQFNKAAASVKPGEKMWN